MKRLVLMLALLLPTVTLSAQNVPAAIQRLTEAITLLQPSAPFLQVPNDGDLSALVASAAPGSTLMLPAAALYRGTLEIATSNLTIAVRSSLPNRRITPADASLLTRVQASYPGEPVIHIHAGVHGVIVRGLDIVPNACYCNTAVIDEGDGTLFDQNYIHGDPTDGGKFGIRLGGSNTTVTRNYISDWKSTWQDTAAVGGYNGPGPFTITDNYLEASGENIIFGGADPMVNGLVPGDIVIRNNDIVKPAAWRTGPWAVKNLFELKNARNVTFENNRLDGSWTHSQVGWAILLTPRNQDGGCPWCVVENVTVRDNVIRNVGAGFTLMGFDNNYPSQQTRNVLIEHNDMQIDMSYGAGATFFVIRSPRDLTIRNNVITGNVNTALNFDDPSTGLVEGFVFTGNRLMEGWYGLHGTGAPGLGLPVLQMYAPGFVWSDNVLTRTIADRVQYPPVYPAGTAILLP